MRPFRRKPPVHDCRRYLPDGDVTPEGLEARCPECGATSRRYDYDDDFMDGTATFCGWGLVSRSEIEDRLMVAEERLAATESARDQSWKMRWWLSHDRPKPHN